MMDLPVAPGVTLCAITSVAREATLAAMRHSLGQIRFEKALLLSDAPPEPMAGDEIEWRRITPLKSREDYSRFVLYDLADHIDTGHVLVVQWDGFVRDGRRWQDAFLSYDYIGAVWPQFQDGMAVGNGGFSLRSRRLLEVTRYMPVGPEPEDVAICRKHRHVLETVYGQRFAELEIARQFSYERQRSRGDEFGFHGAYNLFAELPGETMTRLIGSLEPGALGARESVELMFLALGKRNLGLACIALAQAKAHPQVARRIFLDLRNLIRKGSVAP